MFEKLFGVGKLNQPAFGELVIKVGRDIGRFEDPIYDDDLFSIEDGNARTFLHNVYVQFMDMPRKARIPFLRDWLERTVIGEVPESWDDARKLIMPTVRDGAFLSFARLQAELAGIEAVGEVAARDLAPGLYESFVIDLPTTMLSVTTTQLEKWNISIDEAAEVARDNLRRQVDDALTVVAPNVWCIVGDDYAASRLVLPDLLQRTCSDPLVIIPNRTTLLIGDASAPGIFESLVAVLENVSDGANPHPITSRIFQLVGKTLTAFEPPATSPMRGLYDRLVAQDDITRYQQEQELMNQLESEVFYPKILAVQTNDDRVLRITTWTMGIESALPPADIINFVELDASASTALRTWSVPWTAVESRGFIKRTDAALPRWRTVHSPTADWLDANADDSMLSPRAEA